MIFLFHSIFILFILFFIHFSIFYFILFSISFIFLFHLFFVSLIFLFHSVLFYPFNFSFIFLFHLFSISFIFIFLIFYFLLFSISFIFLAINVCINSPKLYRETIQFINNLEFLRVELIFLIISSVMRDIFVYKNLNLSCIIGIKTCFIRATKWIKFLTTVDGFSESGLII